MKIIEKNEFNVIYFGGDILKDLKEIIKNFKFNNKKVLLITDKESFDQSFYKKELIRLLSSQGLIITKRIRTSSNPSLFFFKKELSNCKRDIDLIFCIGGGSAIDFGKLAKLNKFKNSKIFVLYTLPGSGSIVTPFVIYNNKEFKIGDYSKDIIPDVVYVNKKIIDNLKTKLKLIALCDIYAHAMESLLSKAKTEKSEKFSRKALDILLKRKKIIDIKSEEFLKADIFAAKAESIGLVLFPHAIGHYLTYKFDIPHPIASVVFFEDFLELLVSRGLEIDKNQIEYLLKLKELLNKKGFIKNYYNIEPDEAIRLIEKYMSFSFNNSSVAIPRKDYLKIIKNKFSYEQ